MTNRDGSTHSSAGRISRRGWLLLELRYYLRHALGALHALLRDFFRGGRQ
jgi:hypothetical protein